MHAATASQTVNRDTVRVLAIEHGLKGASDLSGVPYATVRQWSVRGKWKATPQHSRATVTSVTVADHVASELADCERESKASLARSTRRLAKDAEQATLRDSDKVLNVAKIRSTLWPEEKSNTNVMVNVALLGVSPSNVPQDHVSD